MSQFDPFQLNPLDAMNPAAGLIKGGVQVARNKNVQQAVKKGVADIGQMHVDASHGLVSQYGNLMNKIDPHNLSRFSPVVGLPRAGAAFLERSLNPHTSTGNSRGFADLRGSATPGSSTPKSAELAKKQEAELHAAAQTQLTNSGNNDGGNNSPPPRVAAKRPTSVKEAYETLGPGAVGGDVPVGMQMGRLGDVWSPTAETAIAYGGTLTEDALAYGNMPVDIDSILGGETYGSTINYGELKGDVEAPLNAFSMDAGKSFGTIYPGAPRDSMQALRAREQELGIVYASGKHWVDGPDGKLQEIKGSNGMTARERVQQFKRGNLNLADIGGRLDGEGTSVSVPAVDPKPAQTGTVPETDLQGPSFTEPTKTQTKDIEIGSWHVPDRDGGPLWGDGTNETPNVPPVTTQKPRSTKQTPSIPFGKIPADLEGLIPRDLGGLIPRDLGGLIPRDLEGLKLPGGIYDTGRELAETAGGWYGREKAKEKGGNLPLIGGLIQNYGERKGIEKGGELFDQYAGPFQGLFQQ